jgi:hypothetical protein
MGKQSRRKRARRATESAESQAFREHMASEDDIEARDRTVRAAGFDPNDIDFAALGRISQCEGLVKGPDGPALLVSPHEPPQDSSGFDRAICAAGIKRFVRRCVASDKPGIGKPLIPSTPIPNIPLPEFLFVEEVTRGVRVKTGFDFVRRPS